MYLLVVLSTLIALASYNANAQRLFSEQQYAKEFTGWITIRNITYSQDMLETKFNTYKSNYDYVAEHNTRYTQGLETYEVALNAHADLTPDEFRAKRLGFRAPLVAELRDAPVVKDDTYDPACTYPNSCPVPYNPDPVSRSSTGGNVISRSSSSTRVPSWKSSTGRVPSYESSTGRASSSSAARPVSSSTGAALPSSSSAGVQSSSSSSSASSSSTSSSSSSSTGSIDSSSSSIAGNSTTSSTGPAPSNNGTVDWRTSGFLGPIRDQGSCGSCWSFNSVESAQSAWAQKTGQLLKFSTQELLDCVENGQRTCDTGGIMDDAWKWYLGTGSNPQKRSPMSEESYPFQEKASGRCQWNADRATNAVFDRFVRIPEGDENALKRAVDAVPAVAISINSGTTGFMFYKSGVLNDRTCGGSMYDLTHAVAIVGYGTDEATGMDYWLIKNSWGTSWGLDGYMKLRRNANNMCGVTTWASYIVA